MCDIPTPSVARTVDALPGFHVSTTFDLCRVPLPIVDRWEPRGSTTPTFRTLLRSGPPKPMNPGTRIRHTNGRAGQRTTLAIFDASGRLVRALRAEAQGAETEQMA